MTADPISGQVTPGGQEPLPSSDESRFVLDWPAYFTGFCVEHGSNPVLHGGRLLFSDGWTYSRTSHRGPEWPPPPEPERSRLMLVYWRKRRAVVESLRSALADTLEGLRNLQAVKSAQIMHRVIRRDEASGKRRIESVPFHPKAMEDRLEWLTEDVRECDRKVRELLTDLASVPPHQVSDLPQG